LSASLAGGAQQLAEHLAARLGLRRRPRSWGGNCPSCGYHAAFTVRLPRKGKFPLLWCANGCTREQLAEAAQRALNTASRPPVPLAPLALAEQRARKLEAARKLFAGAIAIRPDCPAGLYLAHRGVPHLVGCPGLRFRPDCWHPESKGHVRAMVAEVLDAAGRPLGVHRTYLKGDGRKADVQPQKASLGPIRGGAVRLDPAAAELTVGEGIESAASAGVMLGLPAWAAISAGNLASGLELPPEVRVVAIAADHDGPGRKAAIEASVRWRAEGRTVRLAIPSGKGVDFNDLLRTRLAAEAR